MILSGAHANCHLLYYIADKSNYHVYKQNLSKSYICLNCAIDALWGFCNGIYDVFSFFPLVITTLLLLLTVSLIIFEFQNCPFLLDTSLLLTFLYLSCICQIYLSADVANGKHKAKLCRFLSTLLTCYYIKCYVFVN